jgi:hypothetical protein
MLSEHSEQSLQQLPEFAVLHLKTTSNRSRQQHKQK